MEIKLITFKLKIMKTFIYLSIILISIFSNKVFSQIKVHSDGKVSIGSIAYPSRGTLDIHDEEFEWGGIDLYNGSGLSARIFRKNGYFHLTSGQSPLSYGIRIQLTTGKVFCNYGVWSGSDERLKTNIQPINNALDKIMLLNGKTYNFKEYNLKSSKNEISYGLIAQEVKEVIPEIVAESNDSLNLLAINYDGLIPVLIEAIKEQQQQIAELNYKLQSLEVLTSLNDKKKDDNEFYNFPNPVNELTQINLMIPEDTKEASLNIYSSNGKLVKRIIIKDRGNTEIVFNASKLSAGIYTYSLIADNELLNSNKMIIN
jgi:hypothetical protein